MPFKTQNTFITSKIGIFIALCLLTLLVQLSLRQSAQAETQSSPSATVLSFYQWYLSYSREEADSPNDEKTKFSSYISDELLREIEKEEETQEFVGNIPFVQAEDCCFDDWIQNIKIGKAKINGDTATVAVTLGLAELNLVRLNIKLIRKKDIWKIRAITKIPD
ncbi:DUF3828 domain-containing protein [Herbaspirillum sp. RTI4]|uniref:DUF3828 domain-containing protein n=1 Tax=Herbaspirillum sp. RTI4 TaxID=3048640 RepID=UPI002AB5735C|nr:DUF3828 domain-containing protein [Herbaspirillum sp. RTI4]MDY7578184.1 DUF3828 domain-containing protein [Herbaspirillum sp. RTI4]MEA9981522.1 DUF3828 domain-containing protein [Herbaspirillum sp. RTI4]